MDKTTARIISYSLFALLLFGKYLLPGGVSRDDELTFKLMTGGVIVAWAMIYGLFIRDKRVDDRQQQRNAFWQLVLFALLCLAGT